MAILSDKDRKKLKDTVVSKKNTDTGRTAAEKERKKATADNAAASKKKNKGSSKKKSSSAGTQKEENGADRIRRRIEVLRDRMNAVSQRDAYDSARRKAYGERGNSKESKTKLPSLFDESKSKSGSLSLEDQKKNVQGIRKNAEEVKDRNYWLFNNGANKPVERKANVPLQTQMTTEEISRRKSVEANQPLGFRNEGQAIAAAYVIDVPRDLIGAYDKAVNVPTADYYLNDKHRRFMNGGVKAPVYMGINQQKTAEYEAQAKREGYNSLEEWQIAKANEAMAKTDGYYAQKKELYDTADKYIESGRFDPWVRQAMEVAGQIGAMTPTIATAGAAGGLAKLIGLGGKAAWAFQNLLMGAEISGSVSGLEAKEMYNAVLNQKQNMIAFMGEDAYKAKTGNDGLTIDDYRDALKRANNTGELVGMAEAATEMLFGGIPLMGKGIVNKIGGKIGFELLSEPTKQQIRTFRNTIGGRVAKQVTERLGGTLGEGTEEAIMAVAQPYIETNVAGVESDVSIEDIIHDFGMGAAVSLILGMPVNAVNDTMIAYDAVQQRRQNKDFIKAAEERAKELVNEGQMTEEEAAASVREVRDILSGKGSLRVAEEAGYEEKNTSDTRRIYDSAEEAQKSLENEFKGKKIGDKVKGAYFDGDTVREFTAAKTEEGVKYRTADTAEGDIETYRAKAEKVKSAQNETERSGYQLNVKEEIIKEVSALSKALGRTIVFDEEAKTYNEDGSANVTRGWFDEKDGSIHVNIHNETPAATVVAHEITHSLEKTNAYKAMQKAVFDYYRSSLGAERKERGALYAEGGKTLESAKDVDYEVMANFVETKLLTDKETINYIVKRNKTFGERIVNGINRIVQRKIGSKEQKFLAGVRTKWEAALEESRKEGDNKEPSGDIAYSETEEIRYSIGMKDKLMANAETRNRSTKAVEEDILLAAKDAINFVVDKYGDILMQDNMAEPRKSPMQSNTSYAGTMESTTLCPRSLVTEAIVELVAKKIGRPLKNEESIVVAQELMQYTGDKAECLYCYQANAKRGYEDAISNFLSMRKDVIDRHRDGMDKDTNYKLMMDYNFEKGKFIKKKDTPTSRERFNTFIAIAENKIPSAPALYMLNTNVLNQNIKNSKHPASVINQLKQVRTYAQGAVKAHGRVFYAVYKGQLLRIKQDKINEWNNTYGLRMFSFSDFSPAFLLENMQMVTDASVRGLRMLAYTKEPDFVRIFGGTNMAINISIAGFSDGKGGYYSDGMQGMNWDTAKELRSKYPAVGTVYVAKDDAEVEWAMAQDWIDTVIPFHISYGSTMMQKNMGWKNYSGQQSEKKKGSWKEGNKKEIFPSHHHNDKETYLKLCEENNLIPKFVKWVEDPNYMKLVNETRLSVDEMTPVQPLFDVDAAKDSLEIFTKEGGYNNQLGSAENKEAIADEIIGKVKERSAEVKEKGQKKYSIGKEKDAEEYFGVTADFKEAGYLTTTGKLLDFSGVKFGGRNGWRSMDHREISDVYENEGIDGFEAMVTFMNEGNIRLAPEIPGIDISVKPNKKQEKVLRRYFDRFNGYITLDISNEYGDNEFSFVYPSGTKPEKIINDIRNYFDNGVEPYISEISKYRYSLGKERDREYMTAVESGDLGTAQRMVDQAAKAAGYDSPKLYHGTPDRRKRDNTGEIIPNEDWNVFDPNKSNADRIDGSALFFANNKSVAEFYAPKKGNKNAKVFEVYLKQGKMLTVEGNGANWNRISIPSELPKRKYRGLKNMEYSDTADTTYICKEAKKAGYDSVHFKNIIDGISNNKDMSGDVYAVFDSSQVKSAEPVTYDDKGNVVPLSERFDAGNADIRYSVGKEKRKVSTEMGELIKAYNAEMMGVFYERSSADRRALWDMIHEEMVHVIETGAVRNEKIRGIIEFAYETGYRTENQDTEMKNTWGGGIYVHPLYRGEMNSLGGLQAVNRKMMGSGMYFTYEQYKKGSKTKYGGIDEAYSDLRAANPMMEDLIDPAEQVAAIVDLFGGGKRKQTLKDMDEEFFDTDFVEPYKDDIAKTVEKAFDDISTLARYEMTQKARKEGEAAGEKKGVEKGKKEASKEYAAEQKKKEKERRKQDEEALKMHDTIMRDQQKQQAKEEKKRVDAQRKADESTMRMHDRLIKEVQDEADRKYAAEEKKKEKERQKMDEETLKEHDRLMKEEERKRKKEVKEELNKQAKEYKEAQKAERKSYEDIIKDQEKQKKKLEKEMDQQERQKKREEDSKRDKDRRGERIQLAQQEAKRRREKPQPGSTKSMYLNNKNVRKLCFEFRTDVISRLVEMGLFTDTNGEVVIDNNGMEVAWKTTYGKWEASNKKNEYTPYWGLTTLAEKEGIDADTFYTIYSKLVKMKEQGNTEGKNPKQRIVEYIESLDLTAKQKMFLYFDAAKYAYSNRPGTGNTKPFTNGGTVTEPKGNIRGIMIRLLDDITFDMYRNANMAPTLLQSEESRQIRQKDITDFLDAVFGEETSEQKDQFAAYFMGIIEDFSSQIESARMIAMSNLLIDKPQEKNSLRMNIVRSYRQTKRQFVAEGEAFERMSSKLKDPLYAAYYYGAKKYTAVANEMIYGKGQRGLDGKKQGKSLYQIFEPIFKADEKNKNNEKMKLLTLFVNCRHDQYRLMNGKGYTGYTVDECKDIVERISEKHPEIVKAGDEIAAYGRNLLRMCVESGRLSEEDYQYYTIKYPYYVPAFRYVERTYYDREGKVVRRDKDVIRKAKGGTQPDVLPLFDQMVNKTNEIVKVCKKNQLAGRLANAHRLGATEYIADVRLTEAEERKKKKAEREQKKKEKQAKKNDGVVEKNLVAEEETPMEDMIDAIGEEEENLADIIPWYSNGVKHEIEVADEGILIGWDKLSPIKNEKVWLKGLRKFNDFRRGVLTQYSPTFWFTNGVKDLQDLFLYYPHALRIVPFYAIAVKTMFAGNVTGLKKGIDKRKGKQTDEERKNEAKLQEYLAYGMAESSIFQYDETEGGRRKKRTKVKGALRKPLDLFDGLNFSVEQLPRFAVYLETIDRLEKQRKEGGNEYTDEEIKTIAVYNASDATVNFGRSGTVVKNLNTYGFTFLNAGVQGTSKFVRMFTQVKDGNVKAIAFKALGLGVKLSIFGLSPRILNDIFYGDDDDDKGWMQDLRKLFFKDDVEKVQKEYAEMADYQKLNYYLIYFKGEWIRIPRGRVAAFVRSFEFNGTKVYEGEMDALDLVIAQMDMASDTILFGNPITNNILGPCIEVWNNKDNWGREIVSEYEDKGEGFHYLEYDEDTSDLAIKLAEFGHYLTGTRFGKENSRLLDFSPKKLDHLIQQYLGSYNNLIVPFLSGDQTLSEKGMDALMSLAKKFYVDPTLSNRLAGDYYDLKEEYTNIANAHDGDSPYAVVDYVFKDYNEQLKAKREMIQTITADPNMTRQQKLDRVSEIRAEMNELYRQGIADAKDLLGYADANYFGKEGNREVYEAWLDLTKDSDWKLSTMSDSAQAMYNEISSTGVTTENFVDAYNFYGNLTSDKDENGEPIRGSKKDKFVTYLNSLPATAEQKTEMYYSIGGYSRNKEAPAFADGAYKQAVLTDMSAPLASGGRLSSGYGQRVCPFHGEEFHEAVDIAAPAGTAVGSALSGTVTMAAYSGDFGNTVEVTSVDANGNTIVTKYNHMSELGVEVGDVIGQGVQVGKVGSTGSSTGPHLDFRLKINGSWVDPEQYLDLTAAGIVDSTGYSAKSPSGGTASGGYASSGGGGRKSGGGSSGGRRSSGTSTASTGGRRSSAGSGSSGGSSGGVTLPTASQASAITGRSTKAASYSQGGVTLPTAKDLARSRGTTIAANKSGTGTQRTGTTAGTRFWDENVLG